ncbi:hypothetical protein MKEN_00200300 [Mycena kentingensis (nom. inval.)]|nr:hypothetical protein MKEN_00200300 [Mycena kentingensis (nom. inval.)]
MAFFSTTLHLAYEPVFTQQRLQASILGDLNKDSEVYKPAWKPRSGGAELWLLRKLPIGSGRPPSLRVATPPGFLHPGGDMSVTELQLGFPSIPPNVPPLDEAESPSTDNDDDEPPFLLRLASDLNASPPMPPMYAMCGGSPLALALRTQFKITSPAEEDEDINSFHSPSAASTPAPDDESALDNAVADEVLKLAEEGLMFDYDRRRRLLEEVDKIDIEALAREMEREAASAQYELVDAPASPPRSARPEEVGIWPERVEGAAPQAPPPASSYRLVFASSSDSPPASRLFDAEDDAYLDYEDDEFLLAMKHQLTDAQIDQWRREAWRKAQEEAAAEQPETSLRVAPPPTRLDLYALPDRIRFDPFDSDDFGSDVVE